MAINLMNLTPHKVSTDLSGYITYVYGAPKTGKTTLAVQAPGALLLAFERGYNAIPGIMAQDILSWGEFKQVLRELKKQEVKDTFKTIIVDTVDIAAAMCEKYICNQLGIENIGDGGWSTNGWAKVKKEFEECMRTITQLGYALFFISHAKEKMFKRPDGTEYTQITTSLSTAYNSIVENMADIIGYAHQETNENGKTVRLTLRCQDNTINAGCRFKYIEPEIDFNYDALVKALNDAIEKEASINGKKLVTEERAEVRQEENLDFDELVVKFNTLVQGLISNNSEEEFNSYWSPRIVQITEQYLGKGKKVSQATRDQVEMINLINIALEDLINEKK